jgi:hypothetical protein
MSPATGDGVPMTVEDVLDGKDAMFEYAPFLHRQRARNPESEISGSTTRSRVQKHSSPCGPTCSASPSFVGKCGILRQ